jgi:hypothetical protein
MKVFGGSARLLGLVWTVFAASAYASTITVNNFSFETLPGGGLPNSCGTNCLYSVANIPGWTVVGTDAGQLQPGPPTNTNYFNSVPDGITVAYTNDGSISQTVAPVVQLGATYTLTVAVGVRKDTPDPGNEALVINGNSYFATGTLPTPGNWATFTSTYVGLAADVGSPITIQLASPSGQGDFDNVQLNFAPAPAPEPSSGVLLGLGAVALFGIVRRKRA